jgi:hypothetical protein
LKLSDLFKPKKELNADKIFSINLFTCVLGIVLCLSSLTAATWAWFSDGITSESNKIEAASYELVVSIDNEVLVSVGDHKFEYTAPAEGKTIVVKLTATGTASSGYAIAVRSSNLDKKYYTQQVRLDNPDGISFKLTLVAGETVTFEQRWGTYSGIPNDQRDLKHGGEY